MPLRRTATISITTATMLKAAAVVLGLWLLWELRDIFALLVVSLLLAALIAPFADWMQARRIPRGLSVVFVYTLLLGFAAAATVLVVPIVVDQVRGLAANAQATGSAFVRSYDRLGELSTEFGLEHGFRSISSSVESWTANLASSVFSTAWGIAWGVVALLTVFALTYFLVVEEEAARRTFMHLAPHRLRPRIERTLSRMQEKIGAWLRGQIVLALIVGAVSYIGLAFLQVPYALLLAVIAGALEIIPFLGPTIALIPAALLAFTVSPMTGLLVIVLYLVIQQVENDLLVPKVMQRATGLNPIVSILALLVGAKAGGLVGVILAIPLAIMATILFEEWLERPS